MTPRGVHVETIVPVAGSGDLVVLSADERRRAAGIGAVPARLRFVAGRAGLRRLLAGILEVPPEDVALAAADGAPTVVGEPVHCSVSHTEGLVVVAVSTVGPIGVDVEAMTRVVLPRLATWLTPDEVARLPSDPAERHHALLRAWTAKEAVAKGLGRGLGLAFHDVVVEDDRARVEEADESSDWHVSRLDVGPAHVATLAVGLGQPVAHGPHGPDVSGTSAVP